MSGYTIRTPVAVLTTIIQDFQTAGSIDPKDIRDLFASVLSLEPNPVSVFPYTLGINDVWQGLVMTSGSAASVIIPPNSAVPFQVGSIIPWYVLGAGLITFAPGAGVNPLETASSLQARGTKSSGDLWQRAANTWVVRGDLT